MSNSGSVLSHFAKLFFVEKPSPQLAEPEDKPNGKWWYHFAAGGIAGAVAKTCIAPIDRTKTFLQVHGKNNIRITDCVKTLVSEGGLRGMWRGNLVHVSKSAPEYAVKFMAYEGIKMLIQNQTGSQNLGILERLIAGSLAGAISQTAVFPMEVMTTRLILGKTGEYKNFFHTAKTMFKKEGLKVFYRGYVPSIIGILPYCGIDFTVYETLKNKYCKNGDNELNRSLLPFCGMISGFCAQLVTYPLGLLRVKLQAKSQTEHNWISLLQKIYRKNGIFGLYRGMSMSTLKIVPSVAITYIVYEYCCYIFGVKMT